MCFVMKRIFGICSYSLSNKILNENEEEEEEEAEGEDVKIDADTVQSDVWESSLFL